MPSHRILPATEADFGLIQDIAHATWPATFGDILSPEQITYMLDLMYAPAAMRAQVARGHLFHLLLEPDAAANGFGYAAGTTRFRPVAYVSHQLDYLPGVTKIHKLYARPQVQGKGYGRALVNHVARLARRAGQHTLRLDVNYENAAVRFYEHLGFVKVERCNTDIGNGYLMEDWVMEMPLDSSAA